MKQLQQTFTSCSLAVESQVVWLGGDSDAQSVPKRASFHHPRPSKTHQPGFAGLENLPDFPNFCLNLVINYCSIY